MNIIKLAAFSDGSVGGNPAGIVIEEKMPRAMMMRQIASEVGFSETAFAVPQGDGWRVRYFSPESEVPFCCLLYTSPSPRDRQKSRMPSSA